MNITKKTVPLQYVLETICEDVIDKKGDIITLEEKIAFVNSNLPCFRVKGSVFTLKKCVKMRENIREVPFFNYLLLESRLVMAQVGDRERHACEMIWTVRGFNTFAELEKRVVSKQDAYIDCVYVRCGNQYQKALLSFSYQSPQEERNYVYKEGFYIQDFPYVGFYRNPKSKYFFEICGLCEIYRMEEVRCCLISSIEEMKCHLEMLCGEVHAWRLDKGIKSYKEQGETWFNNEIYKYELVTGEEGFWVDILNEKGEKYCMHKYGFCGLPLEACDDNRNCYPDLYDWLGDFV